MSQTANCEAMRSILFLCTGNYYRSRFAEAFFNWHADQRKVRWKAFSRGLALVPSNPGMMSRHTIARLNELAIPIEAYQRPPIDVAHEDFVAAHHIVAVKESEHRELMQSRFPAWTDRVEFWDVHDLDCAGPLEAIPHLEREVLALVDRLAKQSITDPQPGVHI